MSTETPKLYAEEEVRRGMELLNTVDPNWRERVNAQRLDMSSGYDCVLGQVGHGLGVGGYYTMLNRLFPHAADGADTAKERELAISRAASGHGFYRFTSSPITDEMNHWDREYYGRVNADVPEWEGPGDTNEKYARLNETWKTLLAEAASAEVAPAEEEK